MFIRAVSIIVKLLLVAIVIIFYCHYFIPQSWGFYTIQSNHPLYNIYNINNGVAEKSPILKNNFFYGMGMSRKGKILYSEIYGIVNKELLWKSLNEDSLNFLIRYGEYVNIVAGNEYPDFKGHFLITKTERPSFFILKNKEHFNPSKKYILAHIR